MSPEEDRTRDTVDSEPKHYQLSYSGPQIAFILAIFYWLNHWLMKEGRKPEYPEKTPDNELHKMPHTKAWKSKPQLRLQPTL